jgi:hypothetical protein
VTRKAFPIPAAVGAVAMALLAGWGLAEYTQRTDPALGGRAPWTPPTWAEADYLAMCRESRACVRSFTDIRWYWLDADTLPRAICPQGREVWGCFDATAGTITLAGRHVHDSILIRHEMQHAALERVNASAHPCRWFNWPRRTLWLGVACEGGA